MFTQDGVPKRPKIAPRRVQDRLGSLLFHLDFVLRFLILLGSVLVPFWVPEWAVGGRRKVTPLAPNWGYALHWEIQDGLGTILVRSFFRLAVWDLGVLLGSFWGVPGALLGHLGLSWACFWVLRVAFWNPITLYAHQLVNVSTLQPVPRQHFVTRAGGLRAERLNK